MIFKLWRCAQRSALFPLMVGFALCSNPVAAQDSSREAEMAQCLPGEMVTWGDAADRPAMRSVLRLTYDHASAPPWFSEANVRLALSRAATSWSQCGVSLQLDGEKNAGVIAVGWSDIQSRGNFGLANWNQQTLTLGPAAFALLRERKPAHDSRETLQMVISHEMGHLMRLMSHSRRCIDVTSSYDNGKGEMCIARDRSLLRTVPEYRASLPTACDIARCRVANGLPPLKPPTLLR